MPCRISPRATHQSHFHLEESRSPRERRFAGPEVFVLSCPAGPFSTCGAGAERKRHCYPQCAPKIWGCQSDTLTLLLAGSLFVSDRNPLKMIQASPIGRRVLSERSYQGTLRVGTLFPGSSCFLPCGGASVSQTLWLSLSSPTPPHPHPPGKGELRFTH